MNWKKLDKYFLLSWRKFGIIIGIFLASVILHNIWYAIFGLEEAVFFIIAVLLVPLYLIVSVIYSLFKRFKR